MASETDDVPPSIFTQLYLEELEKLMSSRSNVWNQTQKASKMIAGNMTAGDAATNPGPTSILGWIVMGVIMPIFNLIYMVVVWVWQNRWLVVAFVVLTIMFQYFLFGFPEPGTSAIVRHLRLWVQGRVEPQRRRFRRLQQQCKVIQRRISQFLVGVFEVLVDIYYLARFNSITDRIHLHLQRFVFAIERNLLRMFVWTVIAGWVYQLFLRDIFPLPPRSELVAFGKEIVEDLKYPLRPVKRTSMMETGRTQLQQIDPVITIWNGVTVTDLKDLEKTTSLTDEAGPTLTKPREDPTEQYSGGKAEQPSREGATQSSQEGTESTEVKNEEGWRRVSLDAGLAWCDWCQQAHCCEVVSRTAS